MAGLTVTVTEDKANPAPNNGHTVTIEVAESSGGGSSVPLDTTADFDTTELRFVSAVPTPTSVTGGHIVWPQVMMPDIGYTYSVVFTCAEAGDKTVDADATAGTSTGKGEGDVDC